MKNRVKIVCSPRQRVDWNLLGRTQRRRCSRRRIGGFALIWATLFLCFSACEGPQDSSLLSEQYALGDDKFYVVIYFDKESAFNGARSGYDFVNDARAMAPNAAYAIRPIDLNDYPNEGKSLSERGIETLPHVVIYQGELNQRRIADVPFDGSLKDFFAKVDAVLGPLLKKTEQGTIAGSGQPGPSAETSPSPSPSPSEQAKPTAPAKEPSTSVPRASETSRLAAVEKQILAASVLIRANDAGTSGTVIGRSSDHSRALIATCAHGFHEIRDDNNKVKSKAMKVGDKVFVKFATSSRPEAAHHGVPDGLRGYDAYIVLIDDDSDIGYVVVDVGRATRLLDDIVPRPLSLTRLSRGDRVIGAGGAWGSRPTLHATIVSQIVPLLKSVGFHDYAMTRYRAKPGQSGGGLFNLAGELVGVCRSVFDDDPRTVWTILAPIPEQWGTVARITDYLNKFQPPNSASATEGDTTGTMSGSGF